MKHKPHTPVGEMTATRPGIMRSLHGYPRF